MNKKARRKTLAVATGISLLFCVCLQCAWYYALEAADARFVSPISGENTLIRIQRLNALKGNIDTVFMGSSITERLLSRGRCATVAVSHSPYMTGIQQMKGNVTFAPGTVYVLETTNMMHPVSNEITARMQQVDFRIFKTSPIFSIAAKPTNLLVSSLFYACNFENKQDVSPFDTPVAQPLDLENVADLTPEEVVIFKDFIDGIEELRRMGGKCVFMHYPRTLQKSNFDKNQEIACQIAKYVGIPVLNYNTPYWNKKLHFSDGFHLISRDPLTIRFMNTVARDAHACTDGQ